MYVIPDDDMVKNVANIVHVISIVVDISIVFINVLEDIVFVEELFKKLKIVDLYEVKTY